MHLETQFIKFSPAELGVGQAVQAARHIFHLGIIC